MNSKIESRKLGTAAFLLPSAYPSLRRPKNHQCGWPCSLRGSRAFLTIRKMGMSGLYGQTDEIDSIATIHAPLDQGTTLLETGPHRNSPCPPRPSPEPAMTSIR